MRTLDAKTAFTSTQKDTKALRLLENVEQPILVRRHTLIRKIEAFWTMLTIFAEPIRCVARTEDIYTYAISYSFSYSATSEASRASSSRGNGR